jgi:hypothetical protein
MLVTIKIETLAGAEGVTWHLRKTFDFHELPIPIKGDSVYVGGAFLDITGRCISPTEAGTQDAPRIELFATVLLREEFDRLESIGWKRD